MAEPYPGMSVEGFLGTDEERSVQRLIGQAASMLDGERTPRDFVVRLFAHAAPEDVIGYSPAELASLAEESWEFLAVRKPGAPKIRFAAPQVPPDGARLKGTSVIEIVNDDMPFLVDSVMAELAERELSVRLVLHPIFTVARDAAGRLEGLLAEDAVSGTVLRESLIHIHVDHVTDEIRQTEVIQALEADLADVRACVTDWRPMLGRVGEVIAGLKTSPPPLPVDEIAETIQFLEWLVANNFTFLGVRDYAFAPGSSELQPRPESGLGVLRRREVRELALNADDVAMKREIGAIFSEPKALLITKADIRSRVHRRVFMDYIGVKRFDVNGNAVGEFRIVGLLTSSAYTRSTKSIPYLRRKVDAALAHAKFNPAGHSGKALVNILETYPRDELFQIDDDNLFQFALAILQLDERPRVRVLARRDRFDRFVSVLAYVPRERAGGVTVDAIGKFLADVYKGHVSSFNLFFPETPLVRIHFIVRRSKADIAYPDRATLEYAVSAIVRTWTDALAETLALSHEPTRAKHLFERYGRAFSASYREYYTPATALEDIRTIEGLSAERPISVSFHGRNEAKAGAVALKVWSHNRPIPLSARVPVLENMGFRVVDERTYEIAAMFDGDAAIWLHDMMLERADGGAIDLKEMKHPLEACFLFVMRGLAENDGYNALVLTAGLWWRDVALIRAISRYLRQIRIAFSQDYMWATLRKHSAIAADIAALFKTRFDPRPAETEEECARREAEITARIETALKDVASLDEDRILRHFVNAVRAAIRTNFYQIGEDGMAKPLIAIKFDSRKIDDLPLPRPLYEIFVYSPRVEGVHLRFGKVARGGIRWSDRPQDFRTEILGLVKAQQVKNAVIVPVGAKGGFVPKMLPTGGPRDAVQAEGVAAYKLFISSLLDITDNLSASGVIPPENVVRHDGDDPYFVVAADKGTATFSDTANAISLERKFWLGDAFASGGSVGYDHKEMGITARGAWEAVKRHFREMDVDITRTPFTVAGVGDMSGDVFGNGMLRERTIRLVAAFDHRDIFIDPDPDPEKSFDERARLFALPRSSWQDYDRGLISGGGGVFSRSSKQVNLPPEARALLRLEADNPTPQDVMNAILRMQVDLLWFGGIGTYIRASDENNEAAGDRANDAIRIAATELKCKVIGEGANLGMTQLGRVEAAMHGVRLNTDAIDNSAGVNTSDVEVNIKIALSQPVSAGQLSLEGRNVLLVEMTDEVGELVLRNNYLQTLALSLTERRGLDDLGFQQRLMQTLEARDQLDRSVEFLPDDMELAERRRRNQPLTRPELAVLLAYAKLSLFSDLLDSKVPDDPYLARELGRYFPKVLSERFPEAIESHRLRREIIATQLANSMINRGGPSLVVRMTDETGASVASIATAFAAVRDSYGMPALNDEINALDAKIPGKLQLDLYTAVQDLLLDRLVWFLRNADLSKGLAGIVEHYRDGVAAVEAALENALPEQGVAARSTRMSELKSAGLPEHLARRFANMPALTAAPDVVLVADRTGRPVADVARTYFAARDFFRLDPIAEAARTVTAVDYFDRLALDRARESLGEGVRRLTAEMVANGKSGRDAVDVWVAARKDEVERIRSAIHEIASSGLTLSKLSVAASLLRDMARD
jgi:glutamate dehydrogenase